MLPGYIAKGHDMGEWWSPFETQDEHIICSPQVSCTTWTRNQTVSFLFIWSEVSTVPIQHIPHQKSRWRVAISRSVVCCTQSCHHTYEQLALRKTEAQVKVLLKVLKLAGWSSVAAGTLVFGKQHLRFQVRDCKCKLQLFSSVCACYSHAFELKKLNHASWWSFSSPSFAPFWASSLGKLHHHSLQCSQSKFGRQEEMIHLTLTTYLTTTLLNVTPRMEVFDLVPPCFLSCWAACFKLSISRCGRGEQQGRTTESIDIRHRKIWHQSNQRLVSGFFCDSKTGRSNCTQDAPRCMVATQNQHVFQSNFVLVRQHLKWANAFCNQLAEFIVAPRRDLRPVAVIPLPDKAFLRHGKRNSVSMDWWM